MLARDRARTCVCACLRSCVRACVCVCLCVRAFVRPCVRACVYMLVCMHGLVQVHMYMHGCAGSYSMSLCVYVFHIAAVILTIVIATSVGDPSFDEPPLSKVTLHPDVLLE